MRARGFPRDLGRERCSLSGFDQRKHATAKAASGHASSESTRDRLSEVDDLIDPVAGYAERA